MFDKIKIKEWKPDYGPEKNNSRSGAIAIGRKKIKVLKNPISRVLWILFLGLRSKVKLVIWKFIPLSRITTIFGTICLNGKF